MQTVYQQVRHIPLEHILEARYGIVVPEGFPEARIACPIHHDVAGVALAKNQSSFAINKRQNQWYCHSLCHRGGDTTGLVAGIEHVSPWKASRLLQTWFPPGTYTPREIIPGKRRSVTREPQPIAPPLLLSAEEAVLRQYGLAERTAEVFEIGVCESGRFANRLCAPVHDERGRRVGYIGRALGRESPKYRLSRFRKSEVLYNLHRVKPIDVCLVEGPRDVWRLWQLGLQSVCSFGTDLSEAQTELLSRFERVVIMYDGDDAGQTGAQEAATKLVHHTWTQILELPPKEDPADTNPYDLIERLQALDVV